jgi:hypothetical protein
MKHIAIVVAPCVGAAYFFAGGRSVVSLGDFFRR